jgi:hypothetical protein
MRQFERNSFDLREMLKDAVVGYNENFNNIHLYNEDYNFSIAINLSSYEFKVFYLNSEEEEESFMLEDESIASIVAKCESEYSEEVF